MGRNLWGSADRVRIPIKALHEPVYVHSKPVCFLGNVASGAAWKGRRYFCRRSGIDVALCVYRKPYVITPEILVTMGLLFAILLPFILPHMHERYYFLADIGQCDLCILFPEEGLYSGDYVRGVRLCYRQLSLWAGILSTAASGGCSVHQPDFACKAPLGPALQQSGAVPRG